MEVFEPSNDEGQAPHGDQSVVVTVIAEKYYGRVKSYGFTNTVAFAMCVFFDCKCYSAAIFAAIEWTFYVIASHIAASAMAFEMTYNLILAWSMLKRGIPIGIAQRCCRRPLSSS